MRKDLNRQSFEIMSVILNAGDSFGERFSSQQIHNMLKKEKKKKEKSLGDKLSKNWYRTVRVKELESYMQLLTSKEFIDTEIKDSKLEYKPSSFLRGRIARVCFGACYAIDPFTPDFKNSWQKQIIKNYIRFCSNGVKKGHRYPKTPELNDITAFFKISEEDAQKGITQLINNGDVKKIMGPKNTNNEQRKITFQFTSKKDKITTAADATATTEGKADTAQADAIAPVTVPEITLQAVIKAYFRDLPVRVKKTRPANIKKHKSRILDFMETVGKDTKIKDITGNSIVQHFNVIQLRYADSTMHSVHSALKEFVIWMHNKNLSNVAMIPKKSLKLEPTVKSIVVPVVKSLVVPVVKPAVAILDMTTPITKPRPEITMGLTLDTHEKIKLLEKNTGYTRAEIITHAITLGLAKSVEAVQASKKQMQKQLQKQLKEVGFGK